MSSIIVVTPPAAEPVALAMLKNHLRVDLADDDDLIKMYLQSCREIVESDSGRSLVNKLYRQSHDRFPRIHEWQLGSGFSYRAPRYAHRWAEMAHAIKLLRCPLVSVLKITYFDTSGTLQTLLPTPELWQRKTEYEIGAQIADPSGNLQQVTFATEGQDGGASISGSSAPTWNVTPGGTTGPDGDLTWTNQGLAPAGDFIVDRDSEPPRLVPLFSQVWPLTRHVPNAVQVYFTAGYGNDAADCPASLKVAVMQGVGLCYEHREAVTAEQLRQLDWYERLIWSQRVVDWNPTP